MSTLKKIGKATFVFSLVIVALSVISALADALFGFGRILFDSGAKNVSVYLNEGSGLENFAHWLENLWTNPISGVPLGVIVIASFSFFCLNRQSLYNEIKTKKDSFKSFSWNFFSE